MILRPPTLAYPGLLQKRVLTIRESWKLSNELRHSHECPWIFQPHSTTRGDLDDFMRLCTLQIHRQLWLIFPCGQTLCRCEWMIFNLRRDRGHLLGIFGSMRFDGGPAIYQLCFLTTCNSPQPDAIPTSQVSAYWVVCLQV